MLDAACGDTRRGGWTVYPTVGHSPGSRHRRRGIVGGENASSLERRR